jgi:hypothetical protein
MSRRAIAAFELVLIAPATVFIAAVFARDLVPQPNAAGRFVTWFAGLPARVGLWGLLFVMPLAVLIAGCATLRQGWADDVDLRRDTRQAIAAVRSNGALALVALSTVAAAAILAIVAVHVLAN